MRHPTVVRFLAMYVFALSLFTANQSLAAESEANLKAAIAKIEAKDGRQNLEVAKLLIKLGAVYVEKGRLPEAEAIYKESLAIRKKLLPPAHRDLIEASGALGVANLQLGRYRPAEDLLSQSLEMAGKILDPFDEHIADILSNLALIYLAQDRYAESAQACKRSIEINEKIRGPNDFHIGTCLNALAITYHVQSRYVDAEEMFKRSLAFRQKNQGENDPTVAIALANLSGLYQEQGRNQEALLMLEKAFAILSGTLGADHPNTLSTQIQIGSLQMVLGHYAEAEQQFRKSLPLCENPAWETSSVCISTYAKLGELLLKRGRNADADALFKRATAMSNHSVQHLEIQRVAVASDAPHFAKVLSKKAAEMMMDKRYSEAIPILEQAVAINQKALGNISGEVASNLISLSTCYIEVKSYSMAELALAWVLAINEKALGPDSIDSIYAHLGMATLNMALLKPVDALEHTQIATRILRKKVLENQGTSLGTDLAHGPLRATFSIHLSLLGLVSSIEPNGRGSSLIEESFDTAQVARISGTAQAVAQMAARFASRTDALAQVVRQRQDIASRSSTLDAALIKALGTALSERNVEQERSLRSAMVNTEEKLKDLDRQIDRDYPSYRELTRPNPLTIAETQKLLKPDEALLVYVVDDAETHLWLVRQNAARFLKVLRTGDSLRNSVQLIRQSLDLSNVTQADQIKPFDTKESAELYRALWLPISADLAGVRTVFIVPDGPLQSLPFGVLLESLPKEEVKDFSDYRDLAWIGKRYALSTLPAVNSLRALRAFKVRGKAAKKSFIGFGDPLLSGDPEAKRGVSVAQLFSRGAVGDVDNIRKLPRLADTADELLAQSRLFKAGGDSLYLRERDTESVIKKLDLTQYRVLSFATHGLLAGELSGVVEPALVFTPPPKGTALDDGLLTASEVAQLKLNADWIVMSACNTAGPSGEPGADGLSGLARAFIYAGGRSLLVSHWPVNSEATVALMTDIFSVYASNQKQGKAETVRQGMMKFMKSDKHKYFAHPSFWAPFVLVGEGGVDARP